MANTEASRAWWTLIGSCLGLFVLMLDSTIVSLALPAIEDGLGASTASLQWVANAYLLALAVMVVTASRFGDMFGRKRVYLLGMALFGAGAVISATSGSILTLVVGRVIQGTGGAAVVSLSLALVSAAFPPHRRAAALGIWAGVSAIALAIGPLLGGILVHALSWRWVFWVVEPFVIAGILITRAAAAESRDETTSQRVDQVGLAVMTIGIVALILPLVQGETWGWGSPQTLVLFATAMAMITAFWFVEHRVSNPIVDFSLFRNGPYFGASTAAFTLVSCWWVVIFYQPQYLQRALDYTPIEAGLLVLPVTLPMALISPFDGRLMERFGARALMTVGMGIAATGMFILTRIDPSSDYALVLPGYLLFGISLGLVYAPMSAAAMAALPAQKAGIAAGVLGMNRMFAGAFSIATAGAIFQHVLNQNVDAGVPAAFSQAIADSIWVPVVLATAGTILTWLFVRSAPKPEPAAAEAHGHGRLHRGRAHL